MFNENGPLRPPFDICYSHLRRICCLFCWSPKAVFYTSVVVPHTGTDGTGRVLHVFFALHWGIANFFSGQQRAEHRPFSEGNVIFQLPTIHFQVRTVSLREGIMVVLMRGVSESLQICKQQIHRDAWIGIFLCDVWKIQVQGGAPRIVVNGGEINALIGVNEPQWNPIYSPLIIRPIYRSYKVISHL